MVQVLYCMKIAKPRWAKSLRDGTAWFGSVESYIQKAQKDHNDEQGDAFEESLLESEDFQMSLSIA